MVTLLNDYKTNFVARFVRAAVEQEDEAAGRVWESMERGVCPRIPQMQETLVVLKKQILNDEKLEKVTGFWLYQPPSRKP